MHWWAILHHLWPLERFVPYNISVSAFTNAGEGPEVRGVNFTEQGGLWFPFWLFLSLSLSLSLSPSLPHPFLLPLAPPPVQNVNITRLNDTTLHVTWDPISPINARGFLTTYTISVTQVKSTYKGQSFVTVPASQTSGTVGGLDALQHYNVRVAASTSGGLSGDFSEPISVPALRTPSTYTHTHTHTHTSCRPTVLCDRVITINSHSLIDIA